MLKLMGWDYRAPKLNNLAVLYVHKDVAKQINIKKLVDDFINCNPLRQNTFVQ